MSRMKHFLDAPRRSLREVVMARMGSPRYTAAQKMADLATLLRYECGPIGGVLTAVQKTSNPDKREN